MRKLIFGAVALLGALAHAQTGNVGVNTSTPTENLDVKGSVRVQKLLEKGVASQASSSTAKAYAPAFMVTADANGVLGKQQLDDLTQSLGDNSNSMFVIKRFIIPDWAGGQGFFDFGFSTDKWEAFISGWASASTSDGDPKIFLSANMRNGAYLMTKDGKWGLYSDIGGLTENMRVDVLFIKKGFVTADPLPTNAILPNTPPAN